MNKMKKIVPIIKGILVIGLFFFSQLFQVIPILIFHIDIDKMSDQTNILLSLFSNVILSLLFFLIYRKELSNEAKIYKEKLASNIDTGFKYWFIGLIVMMISNVLINVLSPNHIANNEQAVQSMIQVLPWVMLINTGILAPITEEIAFRKTFFNVFDKHKWLFILTSGIFFGALHVVFSYQNIWDLLYIIPYSALGISFAAMYDKTKTVFTSMGMHFFHNTILTILSILT